MGLFNDIARGIKNSLKWRARSGLTKGIEKGIDSVVKNFKDRCPKCGKPITEIGARFCPHCRAKLVLICPNPNCQREASLGTDFCSFCGAKLTRAKQSPETKTPES